jgi:hypothetical protein
MRNLSEFKALLGQDAYLLQRAAARMILPSLSPSLQRWHHMTMRRFVVCAFLFAVGLVAESFPPADVKVMGDLRYGQTSNAVECSSASPYYAFVFNGKGGERVDVVVKSEDRQAFVAIGDPSLNQLASGTGHLTFTLPNRGPDAEGFYIVFRDSESKDARFTVELKKLPPETSQ